MCSHDCIMVDFSLTLFAKYSEGTSDRVVSKGGSLNVAWAGLNVRECEVRDLER